MNNIWIWFFFKERSDLWLVGLHEASFVCYGNTQGRTLKFITEVQVPGKQTVSQAKTNHLRQLFQIENQPESIK